MSTSTYRLYCFRSPRTARAGLARLLDEHFFPLRVEVTGRG